MRARQSILRPVGSWFDGGGDDYSGDYGDYSGDYGSYGDYGIDTSGDTFMDSFWTGWDAGTDSFTAPDPAILNPTDMGVVIGGITTYDPGSYSEIGTSVGNVHLEDPFNGAIGGITDVGQGSGDLITETSSQENGDSSAGDALVGVLGGLVKVGTGIDFGSIFGGDNNKSSGGTATTRPITTVGTGNTAASNHQAAAATAGNSIGLVLLGAALIFALSRR